MRRWPTAPVIHVYDPDRGRWYLLQPETFLAATGLGDVPSVLTEIETAAERGYSAVGYVAYEAAPALEPAMSVHPGWRAPLAWFAIGRLVRTSAPRSECRPWRVVPHWRPCPRAATFRAAVAEIRQRIASGRVYQVNLTLRWRAQIPSRTARDWAARLIAAQPRSFAAVLETPQWAVVSVSPELFFRLDGNRIECRPMKGTRPRAPDAVGDRAQGQELASSPKDRAENVMILDMVRNDLGRIAHPGSVRAIRLWAVERHPTVWQMTSTAVARTSAPLLELFRALFPPASITGAPKIEAMRTIAELERAPRGVYCGAIGWVGPGRRAVFNVGIRTLWLDSTHHRAVYGAGAGIVWDSDPEREWSEVCDKARVLTYRRPPFQLLETLRWTPARGFGLLRAHLRRLRASAEYFDIPFDPLAVRLALARAVAGARAPRRVRLTVDRHGRIRVAATVLPPRRPVWIVGFADTPIRSDELWVHHKTTHRDVYERARAERPDCDDVILVNERGEVTETTMANLVVRVDGNDLTPAATSGLLRGTLREVLLARGRIREAVLRPADVRRAEKLWLINSVRGWMRANLRR